MSSFSYLDHLECSSCGATCGHSELLRTCPRCGDALLARYDLARLRAEVDRKAFEVRSGSMWAFAELLPVQAPSNILTLGEGDTPLLPAQTLGRALGMRALYIKDEGLNPTGTFKARGLSAAVSRARELGATRIACPSAGNAAGAAAAYAARGGMEAHVFMPKRAPEANRTESTIMDSRLTLVDGLISDAGRLSREVAAKEGLFDISTMQEPYRVEGKKTMALELAVQLGWRMPGAIVYPTGGGTGIIGMWKGFLELRELGWVQGDLPRFICVQAEGCQPLVQAFHTGAETAEPWPEPDTVAHGLQVPHPFAHRLILRVLRETGGTAVAVSDAEMLDAVGEMAAAEGIFPCPEGAATWAALKRLVGEGAVDPGATTVLLNTGSGYKYLDVLRDWSAARESANQRSTPSARKDPVLGV